MISKLLIFSFLIGWAASDEQKPNIILVLADDLGKISKALVSGAQ